MNGLSDAAFRNMRMASLVDSIEKSLSAEGDLLEEIEALEKKNYSVMELERGKREAFKEELSRLAWESDKGC